MPKSSKPRIDRGVDTASPDALTTRAATVGAAAPSSPLYLGNAECKSLIDAYVASGPQALAADAKVAQLEQLLVQARNTRDAAYQTCAAVHAAACAQVEKLSVTPGDVASCGFSVLDIEKVGLVLPSGILATYELATGATHLRVQYAGKRKSRTGHRCVVEVSPTPVGAATFVRLEGLGVKRALLGYAPGTYEVRAATASAQGRGDWFGPVAVIVK